MKKNILVTGGTGFIGSEISLSLHNQGYNVFVFDNFYRNSQLKLLRKNKINVIKGDIRNYSSLNKIKYKINIVIHLAAINGTKNFYDKPCEVLEVASKGIFNILDFCISRKIKNLIIASSSEVYNLPKKIPTKENEPIKIPDIYNPRFSYSTGKILSEIAGINYGRKYFKKLIIFRPHNVYGKNMGKDHVIPELINKIKKSHSNLKIYGSGNEKRSFIHIKDFISAFNIILHQGKHLELYNIGSSDVVTINTLAKKLMTQMNKKLKIVKIKGHIGSTKIRCPDISKIKKLGFNLKYNLDNGIKEVLTNE